MPLFRRTPNPARLAAKAEKERWKEERRAEKQRRWEARQAAERQREERLSKAAGISSVDLICHRDTWNWIRSELNTVNLPGPPPGDATMLRVPLSGPNLVRILTGTWFKRSAAGGYIGDRAIAGRVYDAIAEIVDGVDPATKDGTPVPDIVIDDKIAAPSAVEEVKEDDDRD
jgi:hypothetical protein